MQYIQVVETDGDEPIELPTEIDSTLLLTTVSAQFPGACGLKYRNVETGNLRGLRIQDGRLYSPEENWGNHLYYVVFPKENKRKADEIESPAAAKQKRPAATASAVLTEQKATDLIVLGLPFTCEKEEMVTYFSQFGEVLMAEVKKDIKSGKSKGFGFVRFAEYESQSRVLNQRHQIAGRWCDVKLPLPKEGSGPIGCRKIFIGRCAEHITEQDLRDYFGKYGEVTDVYIPRPFRGFAFVSFADAYVAPSICGEDHIIKGSSVHVTTAEPKRPEKRPHYADDYGPPRGRGDRPDYYDSYGGGDGHAPRSRGDHGWDHSSGSQSRGSDMGGNMANNPLASMGFNLGSLAMNPAMLAAAAMASQNFTNMLMQSAQNSAAGTMPVGQGGQAQSQPAVPPTQPPGQIQPVYSSGNPSYGSSSQSSYSTSGQGAYSSGNQGSYGSANPVGLGGSQAGYGWSSSTQALENGR